MKKVNVKKFKIAKSSTVTITETEVVHMLFKVIWV